MRMTMPSWLTTAIAVAGISATLAATPARADEWKKMLCVEGANILSNAIKLNAGESHTTTVTMSVEKI